MTRQATKAEIARARKAYRDSHWGFEATAITDVNDPDLPDVLVEMGRLVSLVIDPEIPGQPDAHVELRFDRRCVLAYDEGPSTRLYCILPADVMVDFRRSLWEQGGEELTTQLTSVAKLAGGRQCKWPYPRLPVKVVGRVVEVYYETSKKGEDGVSSPRDRTVYVHALGEESGVRPYLAVDRKGRLHFAGGMYQCLPAGITD